MTSCDAPDSASPSRLSPPPPGRGERGRIPPPTRRSAMLLGLTPRRGSSGGSVVIVGLGNRRRVRSTRGEHPGLDPPLPRRGRARPPHQLVIGLEDYRLGLEPESCAVVHGPVVQPDVVDRTHVARQQHLAAPSRFLADLKRTESSRSVSDGPDGTDAAIPPPPDGPRSDKRPSVNQNSSWRAGDPGPMFVFRSAALPPLTHQGNDLNQSTRQLGRIRTGRARPFPGRARPR